MNPGDEAKPKISSVNRLGNEPPEKLRFRLKAIGLFLADQIFSGLFVGPLTVFVWWGTWSYLNAYLYPERADLSGFVCLAIGNGGLVILALTQKLWKRYVCPDKALHWIFGYHLYTCICTFCNVCHWRGMWTILDFYTGINYFSCWITYAIGQGLLWVFRCSRNAQAPPMIIVYDRDPEFFSYTTRFRVKPEFSERCVFDVIFTVVIIHQLVVFYWRGSWELMDLYIFPENKTHSALVSFGIAYGLMIILCVLQPTFNLLFNRYSSKNTTRRLLLCWFLEVMCYFLSNFVSVGLWRGVWLLCDVYVLPDQPDVAHGVILGTGLIGMMVTMCGQSLAIRGCDIDGDYRTNGESTCMCPNFYFRKFRDLKVCALRVEENSSNTTHDAENRLDGNLATSGVRSTSVSDDRHPNRYDLGRL